MTEHYGTLDFVKIITMAPEQPFALETIKDLTEGGITVSIGQRVLLYVGLDVLCSRDYAAMKGL